MSPAATEPRSKKVQTIVTEDVTVTGTENQGLGMPWVDYLASIPEDELEITEVKIYRAEPKILEGFVTKIFGERVDEAWIQERLGGGRFNVRISSKSGKSHFERNIPIAGAPKLTADELAARNGGVAVAPAPATAVSSTENSALLALLEKTIDRLDRLQAGITSPPRSSAAEESVVDIMATAAKRGIELAGGNAGNAAPRAGDSPFDHPVVKMLLDRFMAAPAAPQEDEITKAFKQAMIRKLTEPPPTANKSLIEELKGLGELRELLGWGEAGGGKAEHWTTALIHQAPAVLDKLADISSTRLQTSQAELQRANIIARVRGNMPPPPNPPAAAQPPAVQTSATQPPAMPASPAPGAGPLRMAPMGAPGEPPPAAPPPHVEVLDTASAINTESDAFVQMVKEQVVAMVQAGEPGGGIVAYLTGSRQQKFVRMLGSYTAEQITAALRNDPILRLAVENPDWGDILDEAKEYIREQDQRNAAPAATIQ